MTVHEAIKFMNETGRPVVAVKRSFDDPDFKGYFQLFRNDVILKLMPVASCAADVRSHYTMEKFLELGSYHTFEPYDGR